MKRKLGVIWFFCRKTALVLAALSVFGCDFFSEPAASGGGRGAPEDTTYTIIFNKNSDDASGRMSNKVIEVSARVPIPPNKYTHPTLKFAGWSLTPTGSVQFSDGQDVQGIGVEGQEIIFYAVWLPGWTVVYNGNLSDDGFSPVAPGSAGGSTANSYHIVGVISPLNRNGYWKGGCEFIGWSETQVLPLNAGADHSLQLYEDMESVIDLAGENETCTLYAVWRKTELPEVDSPVNDKVKRDAPTKNARGMTTISWRMPSEDKVDKFDKIAITYTPEEPNLTQPIYVAKSFNSAQISNLKSTVSYTFKVHTAKNTGSLSAGVNWGSGTPASFSGFDAILEDELLSMKRDDMDSSVSSDNPLKIEFPMGLAINNIEDIFYTINNPEKTNAGYFSIWFKNTISSWPQVASAGKGKVVSLKFDSLTAALAGTAGQWDTGEDPPVLLTQPESAFEGWTNLREFTASNITAIGDYAFYNHKAIEKVSLNSSGFSVGNYAFYGCSNLNIPPDKMKVTSAGEYAFADCVKQEITGTMISSLGKGAFSGCEELLEFVNSAVNAIPESAFEGCIKLEKVDVSNALGVGLSAFYGCMALTGYASGTSTLKLPKVTSIGDYAFGKSGLATDAAVLSGSDANAWFAATTNVGKNAFEKCANLTKIKLDKATSIGDNAFKDCNKLTDIWLKKVTSIGYGAFAGSTVRSDPDNPSSALILPVLSNIYFETDPPVLAEFPSGATSEEQTELAPSGKGIFAPYKHKDEQGQYVEDYVIIISFHVPQAKLGDANSGYTKWKTDNAGRLLPHTINLVTP
ncbi:MAG: leucine-rich repeat domain-containing protein [Spirochaetaceae bacterium]|jgi:hypothetical protein|nr:leucine-rich repeat domain-containing protein [Spirochaetaceae bacterium]